jgi:tight adherence protein C
MLILLIASLALAGTGLALAARAALFPRVRASAAVGRIAVYGYHGVAADSEVRRAPLATRLAAVVGQWVTRSASEEQESEIRRLLMAAGAWNATPAMVAGYRVFAALSFGVSLMWLAGKAGLPPIAAVGGGIYMGIVGWRMPLIVLKARARQRLERIELELPELIDLLVVTLEAGLAFNAALQRAGDRMRGPLGEELGLTLQEQGLGLTLQGALANFLDRCDAPAVRAFVRAVAQGESMGISIGQVMRELAGDLRVRRRQIVEEKAQKAPIKILFPLAFFILPATIIIVLFPGLYNIIHTLSGGLSSGGL